ncbi:MAG TPA: SBBP repeat-containing protein, partial [Chloroflexota bacterium]|nr:SBBP repeat-containing protein [Chloroflexota bacterium]
DQAYGIALGADGSVYVTGLTSSRNFPTKNSDEGNLAGGCAAFVSKLDPSGSSLVYSTNLGGSPYGDQGDGIAVDGAGNLYVAGYTQSKHFPTRNPFQATFGGGGYDAFVAKIGR